MFQRLERMLATQVREHLQNTVQMRHSWAVTVKKLGEYIVALRQRLFLILHFVRQILEKFRLDY